MNGLTHRYRTLGELLTELKARLSFVAQGPSSSNNNPVLKSFLQEGHDYLYEELKPAPARKKAAIMLETGSYLYDWHNDQDDKDIDPGHVSGLWVIVAGEQRHGLAQGIGESDRSLTSRGHPTRYDTFNGQCEVWPVPDRPYRLIVEYIAPKPKFTADNHRPGVNDRLILLYALANAKAHYRHPDAQAAGTTFSNLLRLEKAKQHEKRHYLVTGGYCGGRTVQIGEDGQHSLAVG
jgi:hypothetical protein